MSELLREIKRCMVELDGACVEENIDKALSMGIPATKIVLEALSEAMNEIGKLFEEGEYFIAELLEAAEIFKRIMKKLDPLLRRESSRFSARNRLTIVIGTVKGDIHDIGKSLVVVMLQAAGHNVIDLGVDVPAEKFVEAVKRYNAHVVGMSALLTSTAKYMGVVIEELKRAGLRDKVFVIIGGAATSPELAKEIGADAWCRNAIEAVKVVNELAEKLSKG